MKYKSRALHRIGGVVLAGAAMLLSACGGADSADAGLSGAGARETATAVAGIGLSSLERWRPHDFEFNSSATYTEPARTEIYGEFTGPGGAYIRVPGFFTKNGKWVVRFSPTVEGAWTYKTVSTDSQLNNKTGSFQAVANKNASIRGGVVIDPQHKDHFVWENGDRHFKLGYEIDNLSLLDLGDSTGIPKTERLIRDNVLANGFTEVLMALFAEDTTWAQGRSTIIPGYAKYDFGPPASNSLYPWVTKSVDSNGKRNPDVYKPLPAYWENLDRVMEHLHENGLSVQIYLRAQFNKYPSFNFPKESSPEEAFLARYAVARYQAYPNVTFSYAKEVANTRFDGQPVSDQQVLYGVNLAKDHDGYRARRLTTSHDATNFSENLSGTGLNVNIDFYTDQEHGDRYGKIIAQKAIRPWPVYNAELNYQKDSGPAQSAAMTFSGSTQSPENAFANLVEVVMAGGYGAYYYAYHAWDVIQWDIVPTNLAYYRHLSNFIKSTNWHKLKPVDSTACGFGEREKHCLGDTNREYIVYLGHPKSSTQFTVNGLQGATLKGQWVSLYTGATVSASVSGDGTRTLSKPQSMANQAVMLHLVSDAQTPVNLPPAVNAGVSKKLGGLTTTLQGTVSDDGKPLNVLTQVWAKDSGPGVAGFTVPNAAATSVNFSLPGTYVLRLTASDGQLSTFSTVTIQAGATNSPPVVNAGPDTTLASPTAVNILGSVTDDGFEGRPVSLAWSQVSGPGTVVFGSNAASSTAQFPSAGTYIIRLSASDTEFTVTDDAVFTVGNVSAPATGDGLAAGYFSNKDLVGTPVLTRLDPTVNFNWGTGSPAAGLPADNFSVRWTGSVVAPVTGVYTFHVNSNDGNRLWVGGTQLTNRWSDGISEQSGTISLTAGQRYDVKLETYENLNSALITLSWTPPGQTKQVIPKANLFSN